LQDEYIRWHLGKIDGCAAKRCTDVIMEYMNH